MTCDEANNRTISVTTTIAQIVDNLSANSEVITPTNPFITPPTVNPCLMTHTKTLDSYKTAARKELSNIFSSKASEALSSLNQQGDILRLLEEERGDLAWKSVIFNAPRGLLQFANRAITDTLATPANLARWNKIICSKCNQCKKSSATLYHLLVGCHIALEQKRYNTRHDLVLEYLLKTIKESAGNKFKIYGDFIGFRVNGGTVPHIYSLQDKKPDLVLVDDSLPKHKIILVELTIPWDAIENQMAAENRKIERYQSLQSEINSSHDCKLITVEVGARGFITSENKTKIKNILTATNVKKISAVTTTLSKLALIGSKLIYNARFSPTWGDLSQD